MNMEGKGWGRRQDGVVFRTRARVFLVLLPTYVRTYVLLPYFVCTTFENCYLLVRVVERSLWLTLSFADLSVTINRLPSAPLPPTIAS